MTQNSKKSDFSKLNKATVCKKLMIGENNCSSVSQMLLKLSGFDSELIFLSDPVMAENLFVKARQDVFDMKLYQEVLFEQSHSDLICEAHLSVVRYKKGKVSKPKLAVTAVIKVSPFFSMQTEMDDLKFLRLFHLPCKFSFFFTK